MVAIRRDDQVLGHEPDRPEFEDLEDDFENANQLIAMLDYEQEHIQECDNYFYGAHRQPYTPKEAASEYKELARRSITNMVPLIVSNLAQLLYVEGYVPSYAKDAGENAPTWAVWQANRMELRQRPLWRGMLRYGVAYTSTVADDNGRGDGLPTITLHSPQRMMAGFEDPANDERPICAIERIGPKNKATKYRFWRSDGSWLDFRVREDDKGNKRNEYIGEGDSGLDHCAIVRHTYDLDINGRYLGEIQPVVTLQDRLNQTVMDRMVVQTYSSFKVRYATGMDIANDAERIKLSASRMLVAPDEDTKFGAIPETPLDGFIKASAVDQETLSAAGVIPPHYFTGELNNLGPEAIAEARAAMEAKASEIKHSAGEGVKQVHRDIAELLGLAADSVDYEAQVLWHDAQNRSLSQVADALGKLATMLGVPVTELWSRIPGVTQADIKRWRIAYEAEQESRVMREAFQDEDERNAESGSDEPSSDGEQPDDEPDDTRD